MGDAWFAILFATDEASQPSYQANGFLQNGRLLGNNGRVMSSAIQGLPFTVFEEDCAGSLREGTG